MNNKTVEVVPEDRPDNKRNLDILVVKPQRFDQQTDASRNTSSEAADGSLIVLEEGRAVEFLASWQPDRIRRHDLLLGVVSRPMPQLEGAFVAVGTSHDGLLRLGKDEPQLKVGSRVLVRVLREETTGKGPVLSTSLSIPSRYAVFRPGKNPLRRSLTKIINSKEADQLFQEDLKHLADLYKRLKADAEQGCAPRRLLASGDPLLVLLQAWPHRIRSIQVEGPERFSAVERLVREQAPDLASCVRLHPPHSHYDLASVHQVSDLGRDVTMRTVRLPGGGSLVFDRTEALHVIDVNSRAATGKDKAGLAGRVNREAIVEIARQLRIRNLTGMIVVDLIHVKDLSERESLVDLMRSSLAGDRGKTDVYGFSALSLLEMIRTAP